MSRGSSSAVRAFKNVCKRSCRPSLPDLISLRRASSRLSRSFIKIPRPLESSELDSKYFLPSHVSLATFRNGYKRLRIAFCRSPAWRCLMILSRSHPASMNPIGAPKPISLMTSYARNLRIRSCWSGKHHLQRQRRIKSGLTHTVQGVNSTGMFLDTNSFCRRSNHLFTLASTRGSSFLIFE